MNKKLIPVILASTTLLSGCFEEKAKENSSATASAPATAVSKEDAVAVVNGTYISKETLQTLENEIAQRSRGQTFPKEKLLEELIQRELLVQDAIQKQLDKSPEIAERMATVRSSLLSQAAIQNYLKSNPVTDEEIKAEYDAKMGNASTEYKARHILVETEDEAKIVIVELTNGADFIELAKTKSTGPSGPQGGDLGWFTPDRMVPPFSEAVIVLENGKFTAEPVKTQFGWHIILREDSRAQTPPPFEAIKEQIRPMLERQKVQTLMETLRNQAKVEILIPLIDEKVQADQVESAEITVQETTDGQEITETVETTTEQAEQAKDTAEQVNNKIDGIVQSATEKNDEVVKQTADTVKDVTDSANKTVEAVSKP